jgi:hypothetical protein
MVELANQFFYLTEAEAFTVTAPRGGQGLTHLSDELGGSGEGHAAGVNDVTKNTVDRADHHFFQFVEANGILTLR